MNDKALNHIRAFGMTGCLISDEIRSIETEYDIDLGHHAKESSVEEGRFYPQFEQAVRAEAASMSQHYELFYCLETSIRKLLVDVLFDAEGSNWWGSDRIAQRIRDDVKNRAQKEIDSGISRRSDNEIDYTTFGELSVVITGNWDIFGTIFNSRRAVERVMGSLNLLRGPIAHCCPITEDEVDRLHLTVKDWFRTMA
ncbi:hypothetical protein K8B33_09845 [Alcanivorax sp. JB21]|uniref:Swt1 family HEPN domain-containing protein n=1 Tax=Alcanivorax limicola TaxID=2874102 RepID=UPI001CBB7173|nr:Swt1 family HEPN domain-containing protein [Alcanivorax limicola]MBZ2189398.1 hypothetical protein [Alcanivorax limicola]